MIPTLARPSSEYKMIRSIDVRNFRCYRHLKIGGCARLNVIVGDNGSGKTALLESIFLPLATSSEVAVRLRQIRGFDGLLSGAAKRIESALWGDFFYNNDMNERVSLILSGDGLDSRSLEIYRGAVETTLPFSPTTAGVMTGGVGVSVSIGSGEFDGATVSAPVRFTWTDANKQSRTVTPIVAAAGLTLPDTGEDLPDFFFFGANQNIGSGENASRFSELSKSNKQHDFVKLFAKEYKFVTDLNVEVHAGLPVLFGTVERSKNKIPLPNLSGGVNRFIGCMLAIASRQGSVVLIDEIENGLYYSHFTALWRGMLKFLRDFKGQAFVTTHSKECLNGLVKAAAKDVSDIALWRTEIVGGEYIVRQFTGAELRAGIDYGEEVR